MTPVMKPTARSISMVASPPTLTGWDTVQISVKMTPHVRGFSDFSGDVKMLEASFLEMRVHLPLFHRCKQYVFLLDITLRTKIPNKEED